MFMYQMEYEKKELEKAKELENSAYIYGIYTKLAIGSSLAKNVKFPKEPIKFFNSNVGSETANDPEANERKAADEMMMWASMLKNSKKFKNL